MAEQQGPFAEPAAGGGRLPASSVSGRQPAGLLVVALAASWLGFYVITPLPFIELQVFNATIVLHAVTGAVLVPYLLSLIAGRRLPGGSPLDLPVLALLGAYLLATATSLDWRLSIEVSLLAFLAASVFYVLSDGRLFRRWHIEWALMIAALAAAIDALWVVGGDYLDWLRLTDAVEGGLALGDLIPPTVPKVHDVGDHPNILGGILAMASPFFVVGLFRSLPKPLRAGVAAAALLIAGAMFFTLARSSWLGSVAGVTATLLLLAVMTPGGRALLARLRPATPQERLHLGIVAFGLALAMLAAAYALSTTEARPIWLFRESGTPRLDVMGAGSEMFSDDAWLGTGPGMFGLLYPEYSGRFPNHAVHTHNGFLQTAVDMGVPGILAMFALIGSLGWLLVRGMRRTDGDDRLSLIACAGSFVVFSVYSLMEAPNAFKSPLVVLAAIGAVAVLSYRQAASPTDEDQEQDGWRQWGRWLHLTARLAIPVAIAGLLVTWGRIDLGHFYYDAGLDHANAQRWEEAVEDAQRAVDLDPQYAIYRFRLGVVQGQAYLETRDETLLSSAVGQLERGLELEPRSAIAYANLALLLAGTTDREGAREAALSALEFANRDPAVALVAGTALEQSGWEDDAVAAYADAIFQDLGLANSPFWTESPFRLARFSEIVASSAVVLNPCALLWLSDQPVPAGPVDAQDALVGCVQRVLERDASADRVVLGEALIRDGEMELAFEQIDSVIRRQPDYGPARTALGRWYAALGDIERARHEWLLGGQLDEVEALVLLGDSYDPGEVPPEVVEALREELRSVASQVQFHLTGILYYRFKFFRGSPFVILLPGEWRDAVPGRYVRASEALERWESGG